MSAGTKNERKINETLSGVLMPGSDQSIVDASTVSGIMIKDGHIGFTIEIDQKDKDKADAVRNLAEKAVLALDGVVSATAMLTAHQAYPTMHPKGDDRGTPIGAGQQMQAEPHQPAKNVPINKGNYSMDTAEREAQFEAFRGDGWSEEYQEYRSNWSKFPKLQHVSDFPLLVDIELSSICNLKCAMCYTISDDFKKLVNTKRMDFDLFKKIIDEIGGKVPAIRLSLRGEATLHTRFHEAVKYAKSHGIKEVSLLTHGGKLKLDYFVKLVDAGVDWITVSIDGVGDTYERIRKPLKFDRLLENLKNIKDYKAQHNLKRPVIKIQGIWPAISESGVDEYYNTFEPISDLVAFNPLIDYLFKDEDIAYVEEFTCPQQYQRLVIGADGLVMKCSNDEENKEVIGDMNSESVHEVWHGVKMNAIRSLHLEEKGFLNSEVCKRCYLPRKTVDEKTEVNGRSLIVKNYVNRPQKIGD